MRIDNSKAKLWAFCPLAYQERYVNGLERDWSKVGTPGSMGFGSRIHQLLEQHFKAMKGESFELPPTTLGPEYEAEAQALIAGYKSFYPAESFEVVEVERYFEVDLPGSAHRYNGKFDLVVREKESEMLCILDHKSERRNSKDNHPEAWAAREQASRYLWAAEQIYQEPIRYLILDVLTRQSPKGQEPPMFRRDYIERDSKQKEVSIKTLIWIADQIERMDREFGSEEWPRFSDHCKDDWKKCDFYLLHMLGKDEGTLSQFKAAEEYLDL